MASGAAKPGQPAGRPPAAPLPVLFHLRHFGVGGIEAALLAWLTGLDRRWFAPALSVFLPTREWHEVWRERIPADVPVHLAVPPQASVVAQHQARRDGHLGKLGRLWLNLALQRAGRRWLWPHLQQCQQQYPVLIDFDHTLRKWVPRLNLPVLAVRHFAFWPTLNAKARRVGHDLAVYRRVLVLNEAMRLQAEHLYGPARPGVPQCVVVPNLFHLAAMRERATVPLPHAVVSPYAVCVARLDIRTKGLDTLVAAWRTVVARVPEAQLVLVGDGPDRVALEGLIHAAGLGGQVCCVGLQANPYPWVAAARLLVLASRSEGAPNVLVEAMALGTPVVATDCTVGPADLLQGGACGALVPVDDPEALAQALVQAWQDTGWRQTMAQRGLARATDFDLPQGNQRLRQVLAELEIEDGKSGTGPNGA